MRPPPPSTASAVIVRSASHPALVTIDAVRQQQGTPRIPSRRSPTRLDLTPTFSSFRFYPSSNQVNGITSQLDGSAALLAESASQLDGNASQLPGLSSRFAGSVPQIDARTCALARSGDPRFIPFHLLPCSPLVRRLALSLLHDLMLFHNAAAIFRTGDPLLLNATHTGSVVHFCRALHLKACNITSIQNTLSVLQRQVPICFALSLFLVPLRPAYFPFTFDPCT